MTKATRMCDLFHVKARFRRSANIEADYRDPNALTDYILTHRGRDILRQIGQGMTRASPNRAWSITGPYGAGKSAFALFLSRLLGYPRDAEACQLLREADPELYQELLQHNPGPADGGFLIVPVVGSREPLPLAVLRALKAAIVSNGLQQHEIEDLVHSLDEQCVLLEKGQEAWPMVLTEAAERAARVVRAGTDRLFGLLIVIDELGKLLEYAALHPGKSDVYHLQALAELAARSRDNPLGVVVILHQAFEHYTARLSTAERQEWAKVQGRYQDLGFLEPQAQMLKLLGAAIEARPSRNGVAEAVAREVATACKLSVIPRELGEEGIQDLLEQCAPLHPTVALVLGRLFHSRLAQNERSLFTFLSSGEPHSLRDFLQRESCPGDGQCAFYRLDQLHDYVVSALGSAVRGHDKKWAEIEYALDRLPRDSTPLEARLVKAIGLLGLVGDQRYLKASENVLIYALADGAHVTPADVRTALARLEHAGIIIYRQHKQAYGLWEGSDIDLRERFQRGREQIDRSASLTSLLQSHGRLHPYVAKRHLYETGTLRYFAPRIVDLEEIEPVVERPFAPADGAVIFVLARPGASPDDTLNAVLHVAERLQPPRRELLLFAVPRDTSGLREALEEVLAWEWVATNTPELEGDRIARRELAALQGDAQRRLNDLCAHCFDKRASFGTALWVWASQKRCFRTSAELERTLSDACDQAYYLAPIVKNELINRRTLSSAAAAARRNLIERMLSSPTEPRLGIKGYPPELSMYRSVLEESGLHHATESGWEFGLVRAEESGRVVGLWRGIETFLSGSEHTKQPISELYRMLREPPYGVREGLLPIYLAAAVLSWGMEIALYENGTFVPNPDIAVFERLMRVPQGFSIQRYPLDSARWYLFREFAKLAGDAYAAEHETLLSVVRPLVSLVRTLPPYSLQTRNISAPAVAVREAILQAREPHALLLQTLPQAVGMHSLDLGSSLDTTAAFFEKLNAVLLELRDAYDLLLRRIEQQVLDFLGLPSSIGAARSLLPQRLLPLRECVADRRLRAFTQRLGDQSLSDGEWIESVASCVTSKPPKAWNDQDELQFTIELADIAGLFTRVEHIVRQERRLPRTETARMLLLGVTQPSGHEHRGVAWILPTEEHAVEVAVAALTETVRDCGVCRRVAMAALGEIAAKMLATPSLGDQGDA